MCCSRWIVEISEILLQSISRKKKAKASHFSECVIGIMENVLVFIQVKKMLKMSFLNYLSFNGDRKKKILNLAEHIEE